MVIRPQSGSTATEDMASAPMALGEWIDDPKLLVCSHEGYRWQWQALPGQQPQWVPVSKVRPVPQVDAMAWDAGPQRPTVVLPLAAQPKASVALCPPKAGPPQPEPPGARLAQMAQPEPKPEPKQDPAPPPGPPPQQQQPPVQHGPGPTEGHNFVAALGEWQRQQTALREQQSALQQQARALQEAALQQLREDLLRPQQQQQPQPMPEQHAGMQDQQPMAMPDGMHQAVPRQQAPIHQELGFTMPVRTVLAAPPMWPQGQGAGNATAAAPTGNAAADSGIAASGTAGAASGSAAAGSGTAPSAAPRSTKSCQWNCPEKLNVMKGELSKAKAFFEASVDNATLPEQHKADCQKPKASKTVY